MIIGIDPGVQNIGIAAINDDLEVDSIEYWKVSHPEHIGYINIVSQMADFANGIHSRTGEIPKIYIEKPFFTPVTLPRNIRTLEVIGLFKYALYARCGIQSDDITMLSPASIKKHVTGSGRASKEEVIKAVQAIFNQTRSFNSHEADALAVAYTGYRSIERV